VGGRTGARAGAGHAHARRRQRGQPRPRGGARGRAARPALSRVRPRTQRRRAPRGDRRRGRRGRRGDGDYEDAVARAAEEGGRPGVLEIADVGRDGPASWVVDGYATLFDEAAEQAAFDVVLVPVGVGSLAAAAARFGASTDAPSSASRRTTPPA
jgi:hypothetical protein